MTGSKLVCLAVASFLVGACTPYTAQAPDGFAAFEESAPFRAVSPEGVTFRVRHASNEPEATLEFWSEALKKRMDDAGYVFVEEGPVTASGTDGYLLELAAPLGQRDFSYLIGVFVVGDDLVIVESSGEVSQFRERRKAVVEAIQGLSFT